MYPAVRPCLKRRAHLSEPHRMLNNSARVAAVDLVASASRVAFTAAARAAAICYMERSASRSRGILLHRSASSLSSDDLLVDSDVEVYGAKAEVEADGYDTDTEVVLLLPLPCPLPLPIAPIALTASSRASASTCSSLGIATSSRAG